VRTGVGSQKFETANQSVEINTITMAVPNINSSASLNMSGFINSSRRISTPKPSF
jgi:hypothetical protein